MKKLIAGLVGLGLLLHAAGPGDAADPEDPPIRIAVAADGEGPDSAVADKGGRCAWLLFFDEKGELSEAVENPHREARGDAGNLCAGLLAERGVTLFVAGRIGGKMAAALEGSGIAFTAFSGIVKDAVQHVLKQDPPRRDLPEDR